MSMLWQHQQHKYHMYRVTPLRTGSSCHSPAPPRQHVLTQHPSGVCRMPTSSVQCHCIAPATGARPTASRALSRYSCQACCFALSDRELLHSTLCPTRRGPRQCHKQHPLRQQQLWGARVPSAGGGNPGATRACMEWVMSTTNKAQP